MNKIKNPILSGFYPDPSICAVGEDFYLVTSTFAYFPGVPIFHSKDLVNWNQIGNVLDRKSQLNLEMAGHSEGIFAPTLRYHNGKFYMITTNISHGGNFIVTAEKPEGPWSDPYWLEGAEGIDPSLFFDDDGKAYYIGTRPNPEGVRYNGDWEVWIQELDLNNMCLVGESHKIWKGALRDVIWPEGPHLYKKDGYYYLMIAEGGTGPDHCITIARSADIYGKYEGCPRNPIITHRHLGKTYPIKHVGHGDLVKTKDDKWFIVMLASRMCDGFTNLGRETFLAKVTWEEGWPVVNPGSGILELEQEHELLEYQVEPKEACYHFYGKELDDSWMFLRNPSENLYSLTEKEGCLRLHLKEQSLKDLDNPAYIGIRQKDYHYIATTMMEFKPNHENESAGIAIVQSNEYHMRYEYTKKNGKEVLQVVECMEGKDILISEIEIDASRLYLKIVSKGQRLDFYYGTDGNDYKLLKKDVHVINLSTEVAGGFVGCTIGMYGSSNGEMTNNYADFHWFEYKS
ncbi:glycoside hydrolase family 43 protein [Clostridium sp.]|uniref:glycoside hydrolase family 43 protein n=1 Tax=Clostridium sp. TaxID=1506 RepID=UPI00285069F3|nr:glycoside hydrolase family 43 protein [Clostridium sp.]MDR3597271.1 glycoside hydrolase family 43 protein [Clostridium sp.]